MCTYTCVYIYIAIIATIRFFHFMDFLHRPLYLIKNSLTSLKPVLYLYEAYNAKVYSFWSRI